MGRAARVTAATTAVLLLGAVGYAAADAYDVVPGLVTLEPAPSPPVPFPTAPAATEPPPVTALLDPPDETAPVPDAAEVAALAQAAANHRWMGGSTGVLVADQLTGEVLADLSGDVPQVPASTVKLLTAVAALGALGPESTFETTAVQTEPGRVVVVGGGDVMLAAGAGDPVSVNGRAGLADLAAQTARSLRLAGTTEVSVGLDDTLFTGPTLSPGWDPAYLAQGFVAPVAALEVNIAKTREEPYPPRYPDPAMSAAQTFATLLAAEGVTVTGPVTRTDTDGAGTRLGVVHSAPVRDVVRYSLQTSDNTVTEALGRMVAHSRDLPASFDGATTAVLAAVAQEGVDVEGAVLADASGLAAGSAVPPRLLGDLLLLAGDPEHADLLPVAVDMAVGGWQGTLSDRFVDGPAEGLVRAKTGSLPGVTSLAGTVTTQQGRQLVFAVMADETPPGGQLGPRRVIDAFVQQLAGCGCPLP